MHQVVGFETLGGDLRSDAAGDRRAQAPGAEDRLAGFDQHAGEVLRQHAAQVLPLLDVGTRDARLQVLAVMVLVVPDARGLVIAPDPDHRVGGELPAELKALEIALVVREQVLGEELELSLLQAEQHVRLQHVVLDLGGRCAGY